MKTTVLFRSAACATAFGCLLLAACGGNASMNARAAEAETEAAAEGVLEIDALLASADALNGRTVTIEGVCTHTCKHGARKIFLMGSDDTQTIRVESGALGHFDPACVNRIVRVTGRLGEQRIDEACLTAWEAQARAQLGTTEAGCDAERAARSETADTFEGRIADFRRKIAAREAAEGKAYLSFYYLTAGSYEIR